MPEKTVGPSAQARQLPSPDETEYLRDLMGVSPSRVTTLDRDWTLYVRADGDDNNSGLYENEAVATLQAAIRKLPFSRKEKVIIDVGPGDFAGCKFGRIESYDYGIIYDGISFPLLGSSLVIRGTTKLYTPATGVNQGIAAGGIGGGVPDDDFMVLLKPDGAPDWTPGDLVGKRLDVLSNGNGPKHAYIIDNSEDEIVVATKRSPEGGYFTGTQFEIRECLTRIRYAGMLESGVNYAIAGMNVSMGDVTLQDLVIHPDESYPVFGGVVLEGSIGKILIDRCIFRGDASGKHAQALSILGRSSTTVRDCLFDSVGGSWAQALWIDFTSDVTISQTSFINSPDGTDLISVWSTGVRLRIEYCYLGGNDKAADNGIRYYGYIAGNLEIFQTFIEDMSFEGILLDWGILFLSMNMSKIFNCRWGISGNSYSLGGSLYLDYVTIKDCVESGIVVRNADLTAVSVTGDGNGDVGIDLDVLSRAWVGAITITGDNGDARMPVTGIVTYSTDIPNAGDSVVDSDVGAIILRRI